MRMLGISLASGFRSPYKEDNMRRTSQPTLQNQARGNTVPELKTVAGLLINASGLVILLSNLAQWHAG